MKKTQEQMNIFSGKQFRLILKRSGVKATELAKRLNTSDSNIWKYGNDQAMPRQDRIEEMAKILSVAPSDFAYKEDTDEIENILQDFTSPFTEEEQRLIHFFLTRPRSRQEKLFGLFEGILIGGSYRTGKLGSDLSQALAGLSLHDASEQKK